VSPGLAREVPEAPSTIRQRRLTNATVAPASDHARDDPELAVKSLRIGSDEEPKTVSIDKAIAGSPEFVNETALPARSSSTPSRWDRRHDPGVAARDGQITVVTSSGPLPIDTSAQFYNHHSNYRVARTWLRSCWAAGVRKSREIAWSPYHDKASPAPSTESEQPGILENLATTRFPTPQPCGRVPRGGRNPFNITTPRYDATTVESWASPRSSNTGTVRACPHGPSNAVGLPEVYLPWVRSPAAPAHRRAASGMPHGLASPRSPTAASGADAQLLLEPVFITGFTAVHHRRFCAWQHRLGVVVADAPCLRRFLHRDFSSRVRRKSEKLATVDSGPTSLARMTLRQLRQGRQWPWWSVIQS